MKAVIKQITQKKLDFEINWKDLNQHSKKELQQICSILNLNYEQNDKKEVLINKINTKLK